MAMLRYLFRWPKWLQRPLRIQNNLTLGIRHRITQSAYQTTYVIRKDEIARNQSSSLRPFEDIPQDRRLPIVSLIMDIYGIFVRRTRSFLHLQFYEAYKRHGAITVIHRLNKKIVLVSDPEICAEICRQEGDTPRRKEVLDIVIKAQTESRVRHNIPKELSASDGEEWRRLRKIFNKGFMSPTVVKKYFEGFDDSAQSLVRHVKDKIGKSGYIESFKPIIDKWAMESFGTFAFGKDLGAFSGTVDERMQKCFNIASDYLQTSAIFSLHPIMKKVFRKKYRIYHQKTRDLADLGLDMMKEDVKSILDGSSIKRETERRLEKSFMAYLLQSDKLPKDHAVIFSLDMFRVSLSTTAITATWLMYLLGTNPEAQEKLYEEIQRNMSADDKVDYYTMQRMPYLRACMKEQLRLHPSVTILPRTFLKPISAGGYHIPEKTVILISLYNMGREEKLFADPHLFLPKRWLREKDRNPNDRVFEQAHPFASIPFSVGPRSCVGRRVAEAELQTLIAHIVKNFKFRYVGPEATGVTKPLYYMEHPLSLMLEQRM